MKQLAVFLACLVAFLVSAAPADAYELATARYSVTIDAKDIGNGQTQYDTHVLDLHTKEVVASPQLMTSGEGEADSHTMVNGFDLHIHIVSSPELSAFFEVLEGGKAVESARGYFGSTHRDGDALDSDSWHREVTRIGNGVKAPQLTHRVDPSYTDAARAARTTGIVVIAVLIDKSGAVADTQVLKGLPDGLTEAALAAVRQWTFAPSMRDGVAIDVVFKLTVNFKVDHKAN